MSGRGAAAVLGGLVLLVGVILGFVPHSIPNQTIYRSLGDSVSCGSPFSGSEDASTADFGSTYAVAQSGGLAPSTDFEAQCSSALAGFRVAAWVLIGVGGLVLLFVGLTTKGTGPSVPVAAAADGPAGGAEQREDDPAQQQD